MHQLPLSTGVNLTQCSYAEEATRVRNIVENFSTLVKLRDKFYQHHQSNQRKEPDFFTATPDSDCIRANQTKTCQCCHFAWMMGKKKKTTKNGVTKVSYNFPKQYCSSA